VAVPPYAPWHRVGADTDQDDGPRVDPNPEVAAAYGPLEERARLVRWARNALGIHATELRGFELWELAAEAGLGGMAAEEEDLLEQVRREQERDANGGRLKPQWRPGMRGGEVEDEARRMLEERDRERETVMFPEPVPEGARPAPVVPRHQAPALVSSRESGGRDLIAERVAALRGEAPPPPPEPSGARLMALWGMTPPEGYEEPDGGAAD